MRVLSAALLFHSLFELQSSASMTAPLSVRFYLKITVLAQSLRGQRSEDASRFVSLKHVPAFQPEKQRAFQDLLNFNSQGREAFVR